MRDEVRQFAELMEKRLQDHDDRPGWKDASADYLRELMYHQTVKLDHAIEAEDPPLIAKYAADIANFAMMITDVNGAL